VYPCAPQKQFWLVAKDMLSERKSKVTQFKKKMSVEHSEAFGTTTVCGDQNWQKRWD
jgi:hypothetical protein